jgi:hypothetical protein
MVPVPIVLDENAARRQLEEAVTLAMRHAGVNYSEALEIVLTPAQRQGGRSVADYLRRGQLADARSALAEIIDDWKAKAPSNQLIRSRRRVTQV